MFTADFEMSLKDSVLRFAMYLKGRDGTCVQNVPFLPWGCASFSPIPMALRLEDTTFPKISIFCPLVYMPSSQESQLLSASAAFAFHRTMISVTSST